MKKQLKLELLIPAVILIISLVTLIKINMFSPKITPEKYNTFINDLNKGNITSVAFSKNDLLTIETKEGVIYTTPNPNSPTLKETLLTENVLIKESSTVNPVQSIAVLALILSLIGLIIPYVKKFTLGEKGILSATTVDTHTLYNFKYNFDSVAGNEEAKESVKDIVDFLKTPEKYTKYGARMPKGVILYGEPGTGKTLIAKAVAGEAGVPFYAISGSDFVQMYVGVGASRVRNLFKKAKKDGKAVIFIDEIDAIGKKRDGGKSSGGSDERDQTLNALLTEMSGFNEHCGIVVMAATNRLDMLDSALLRPGRFDRQVEVSLPDVRGREKILALHLNDKPCKNVNIEDLAKKTAYFSGAKLESLVNEAAILACKENSNFITDNHMDKAFSIVVAGYDKIDRSGLSDEDKNITAYHESGHALISKLVLPNDTISKVTIIPTSKGAGGYTLTIPEDSSYKNISYLRNRIMVLLAGRAAEELIFGKDKITTGAYNDLKVATNLVTSMVSAYGMGNSLGLLNLQEISSLTGANSPDVIKECKETLDSLYEETLNKLKENQSALEKMSIKLLEEETIFEDDLNKILAS